MANSHNKLPTFTTSNVDSSIVDNSSDLKTTGFQANTIIRSDQVNTYLKMMTNGLSGLLDALVGGTQTDINAESLAETWTTYLKNGLVSIIENNKANSATKLTNTTEIGNNMRPVYFTNNGIPEVVNMYRSNTYTMTCSKSGLWYLPVSSVVDTSNFVAYVKAIINSDTYNVGLTTFNNGRLIGTIGNTVITDVSSSSSNIIGNSMFCYSTYQSGYKIFLHAVNIYGDASIDYVSSSSTVQMQIIKLYEIGA